jgi:hypothetical protein
MGRYYRGDINGKFWFAVQDSDDADFFGSTGEAPNTLEYYFDEDEHKESIISGIEFCVMQLGDFKEKIDAFFEEHNGYTSKELEEHLKVSKEKKKTLGEFAMGRNRPNVDDDGGTNE